jgi:hypothetical protein
MTLEDFTATLNGSTFWCLIDEAWEQDPPLESHLETNNPFREAREKWINGYYFVEV